MANRGLKLDDGRCTFCKHVAANVCDRCGDYYCSIKCQRSDWRSHKYVCIAMPCLVPATLKFGSAQPVINSALFDLDELQHNAAEPMPEMQKSQLKSQKILHTPLNRQMPRSDSRRITIAGFRSANRWSVIDFEDKKKNDDNLNKIDSFGKTASPLQAMPKPLAHAIAQFEARFHRVQVLSVAEDGLIKVCFYDIGNCSKRHLCQLREISHEIKQLQRYTKEVVLRNVKNFVLTDKLKAFLYSLKDKEYELCNQQDNSVDLYDVNSSKSLNQEIARIFADTETYSNNNFIVGAGNKQANSQLNQNAKAQSTNNVLRTKSATPASTMETDSNCNSVTEPRNKQTKSLSKENVQPDIVANEEVQAKTKVVKSAEPIEDRLIEPDLGLKPPFQMCTFAVGKENQEVIVLDNSKLSKGYIGCIPPNALQNVVEVQEYFKAYKDMHKPYKPKLLEYCIAKFEGDWSRAKVLDIINATKFLVIYIDFSNVGVLEADDIRRYPSDLNLDCMTNLCLIDGLPKKLTAKQLEFLENEMPVQGKLIIDKIIGCEDDVVTIQCSNIIQKLMTINI